MDSPTQDVFGRRQVDVAWGDMTIMEAWETKHLNGIKYTKYYDETGSMTTRAWILRLAPFLRSLYNEIAWSRRARHAILHNQINSPFHKLPVEILWAIAEYLPPVARLSLRRVCSKLRTCLAHLGPEIQSQSLWMAERFQFVFLLRQDRQYQLQNKYQRRCDKRGFDSQFHRLSCSQCLIIHDFDYFSAGQICPDTSPKSRICAGLEGFIELCEHFSWSAECL
jgi:hypothetical protein